MNTENGNGAHVDADEESTGANFVRMLGPYAAKLIDQTIADAKEQRKRTTRPWTREQRIWEDLLQALVVGGVEPEKAAKTADACIAEWSERWGEKKSASVRDLSNGDAPELGQVAAPAQ